MTAAPVSPPPVWQCALPSPTWRAIVFSILAIGASITPAVAQRTAAFPPAPAALGTFAAGNRVWTVGNPEMIVGPGVLTALPAPDYRAFLVAREVRTLAPGLSNNPLRTSADRATPGEATLSWWTIRTGRARVVWRRELAAGENPWLQIRGWVGQTGLAAVSVRTPGGDRGAILLVNANVGTTQEVVIPPNTYSFPNPSPARPFTALVGPDGAAEKALPFLKSDGTITEPLPLPGDVFFTRWSEDGTRLLGFHLESGPNGTSVEKWYAVDPTSRTVSPIAPPKLANDGEVDYESRPDPADALPFRLVRRAVSTSDPESGQEVWLETVITSPASGKSRSGIRLALRGEPVCVVPDGTGVLFRSGGALYFAAIVSAPSP